jgi:hypothetical protein
MAGASVAAQGESTQSDKVTAALDVIMAYVPTEILTLYVAVLAAIQSDGEGVQPLEWTVFKVFLIATPVVVWLIFAAKLRASGQGKLLLTLKGLPLWEMFAATVAYATWAFALPNSPFSGEAWYQGGLAGIAVLIVATILGLIAPIVRPPRNSNESV